MTNQKRVFVITGAAGTGKTTVANYLQQNHQMAKVITHTTRLPRTGEQNGVDYYFETTASMQTRHLLEQVEYDHHLYGSSLEGLEKGWEKHQFDVIVLDTQGALTYKQQLGDQAVIIFMTVSQPEQLLERLYQRGDRPMSIESRLQSAEYQRDLTLPTALVGKAITIVNDDWQKTCAQLDQLVQKYLAKG